MLAQSFPPSPMRGIAFSTFSAGAPIGAALGMTVGGALTEKTGYVYGFFHLQHSLISKQLALNILLVNLLIIPVSTGCIFFIRRRHCSTPSPQEEDRRYTRAPG